MQIKTKIVSCHTADSEPVKQEVNGAMVFGRVHVGRVKFGSMSLWLPLNRFECLVALKFDRVLLVSSQMSGWSRHLCLVAPSMFGRVITNV